MGWLLRLLLFLLLIVVILQAAARVVGGFFEGLNGRPSGRSRVPVKGTPMVRDPICGTFVVQSRALTAVRGRDTAWFCSEDCRRRWQAARS